MTALRLTRPRTGFECLFVDLPAGRGAGRHSLTLYPRHSFRPFTLLLWRVEPGSRVHQITSGGKSLLEGPVPALLFESDVGRDAVDDFTHRRDDGARVIDPARLGKFFRFDLPTAAPDTPFRLDFEGSYSQGIVVGRAPELALPASEPGVMPEASHLDWTIS
jgi:hypothetical protein